MSTFGIFLEVVPKTTSGTVDATLWLEQETEFFESDDFINIVTKAGLAIYPKPNFLIFSLTFVPHRVIVFLGEKKALSPDATVDFFSCFKPINQKYHLDLRSRGLHTLPNSPPIRSMWGMLNHFYKLYGVSGRLRLLAGHEALFDSCLKACLSHTKVPPFPWDIAQQNKKQKKGQTSISANIIEIENEQSDFIKKETFQKLQERLKLTERKVQILEKELSIARQQLDFILKKLK